ncbi:MAG: hypothetical protein ACREHE_10550 [Rhizomicrobium sp.]
MRDDSADYTHALRVTFAYDADAVVLKRVSRVAMRVLAPPTPPPGETASGHWLAVEDKDGGVLYHMPLHNPFRYDHEIHAAAPGAHARRVTAADHAGTFEVLVPDMKGARRLVLHGPPRTDGGASHRMRLAAVALTSHGFAQLRAKLSATKLKAKAARKPLKKAGKTQPKNAGKTRARTAVRKKSARKAKRAR